MRERLTHSKRQAFQRCSRYFFHRYEQHLELLAQKPGRRRGKIFGEALMAARDVLQEGSAPEASMAAMHSIARDYRQLEETGRIGTSEDADTLEVERAKLEVVVLQYVERYGLKPRREVEFTIPLIHPATGGRSRTFDLAGKIDGVEVVGTRRARLVEDKLVQQVQKPMIDRLPLDAQSSEYADAMASKGWSVEVSYRHTRYPGINPEKAKQYKTKDDKPAESLVEFQLRLRNDMVERADWYFDEQILTYPTSHLEDYRDGRWGVAQRIIAARLLASKGEWREAFPMNPDRCWEFGGCEFIPICTRKPNAIELYEVTSDNQELSYADSETG